MKDKVLKDCVITLKDGQTHKFPYGTSFYKISKSCKPKDQTVGVLVNNKIVSLHERLEDDCNIEFLDLNSKSGNKIYVAGLKMIFEYAFKRVYPKATVRFLYSLPRGLVAEIDYEKYLTKSEVVEIDKAMSKVVSDNLVIEKLIVANNDGIYYYDKQLKNKVKADNIRNITDPTIVLYRLDDIVNYYYSEMPYSTEVISKYELNYLGKNTFVITWPTETDNGVTKEYVGYEKVIEAYQEGKAWLDTMNVPYINDVNREISQGRINNFIKSCELNFNLEINETAKEIAKRGNIKCVMISGPSSSGKTTVTKRLASYFAIYGLDPIIISLDDYFHERKDNPKDENGEYDFEGVQATDIELLTTEMLKLFNGKKINVPKFNFVTGSKEVSGRSVQLKKNSIILFEGLHAINDDVLPMISDLIKYKIYVSPYIPLCLDQHNYISLNDLRLIRRIVRDSRTRGYGVNETLKYWIKVRKGEEKNIIPFIHQANKIINTSLPYEVGVLKVFVEPLLYSVPADSEYYSEARKLLSFLKQFFAINSEFIPKDSIVREFIGGANDD